MIGLIRYHPLVRLHLGPFAISPHGLGIAAGFLLGARLMLPAARARGIDDEQSYALLTRAAIGAMIGARFAYVLNHAGDYSSDPVSAFAVWQGGISLFGGIVGAVLAALPRMRREGLSFWEVMDAAAPGLALGIAVGRIGDLVVGDHLGKPTRIAWGFACRGVHAASPCAAGPGQGVHLPALYDLVSTAVLLGVLLWIRGRPRPPGLLIGVFAAWYSAGRLVEDFFRVDVTHGTGLTGSQWTAVAAIVSVVIVVAVRRGRRQRTRNGAMAGASRPRPDAKQDDSQGQASVRSQAQTPDDW